MNMIHQDEYSAWMEVDGELWKATCGDNHWYRRGTVTEMDFMLVTFTPCPRTFYHSSARTVAN